MGAYPAVRSARSRGGPRPAIGNATPANRVQGEDTRIDRVSPSAMPPLRFRRRNVDIRFRMSAGTVPGLQLGEVLRHADSSICKEPSAFEGCRANVKMLQPLRQIDVCVAENRCRDIKSTFVRRRDAIETSRRRQIDICAVAETSKCCSDASNDVSAICLGGEEPLLLAAWSKTIALLRDRG